MNIDILRYSLFSIAGGHKVDHTFVKFILYPLTIIESLDYVNLRIIWRLKAVWNDYSQQWIT